MHQNVSSFKVHKHFELYSSITVTGNANYDMLNSQFNIFGLSQPDSSMKLIRGENGQRNGFPYR